MAGSPPHGPHGERRHFTVPEDDAPERIDRWLARQNPDLSRTRVKQLIDQGLVQLDGLGQVGAALVVKPGQSVFIEIPQAVSTHLTAQAIDLDVVYEDEHLIVLNKPAGLVVHPAPGNPDKTLVNALLAHCGESLRGIGGELRPGIVHRLDKDTSGLLVAAKSGEVHAHLAQQFAEHSIARAYDALVWGVLMPRTGVISGQIGRSTSDRKKMAVRRIGGKYAETHYKTLESFAECASWVECVLRTGRTHQIRVHLSSQGHGVIGDPVYVAGRAKYIKDLKDEAADLARAFPRQALHARVLGFIHPISGEELHFERPAPDDFQKLAETLRAASADFKKRAAAKKTTRSSTSRRSR